MADLFEASGDTTADKLDQFVKYITGQNLSMFSARYEVFKQGTSNQRVNNRVWCLLRERTDIVGSPQCGAGTTNYNLRIIRFDTFSGNTGVAKQDKPSKVARAEGWHQAEYVSDSESELVKCN